MAAFRRSTKRCATNNESSTNNNARKRKKEDPEELAVQKYQDDSDFDEAFKNLLQPIELIAKTNHYEYNLIKELDSYLYHLRGFREGDSVDFVEAALMFQNIILIYQKRVDHLVDFMMKLVRKFRAYRVHQKDGENEGGEDDVENVEGNKRKKKEKKVKYYPTFEPINGQIFDESKLKKFDCKLINLTKLPPVPKIVLNANIKVDNKYNQILPYIFIGNGENIGKKYDFMVNYCLNRTYAVNEEFDCPTNDELKNNPPPEFQKNIHPLPSLNDVEINADPDDSHIMPEPVVFDQTVTDEICVANALAMNPANVLNVSQIPETNKSIDDCWLAVTDAKSDMYSTDKNGNLKVKSKKMDNNDGIYLPTYVISELFLEIFKLKTGLGVDPAFRELVSKAQSIQRSDIAKKRPKNTKDEDKIYNEDHNEDLYDNLLNGGGFEGFDDIVDNENNGEPDLQEPDVAVEDFQTYKKNIEDMKKHEQNQIEHMNEQLEMRKRVQAWHDNLRPILEDEERRTAFDIHEYGTRILDCFEEKGVKKSFEQLVSGQMQGEVARYFLSSLMLANTYNLSITKPTDDPLTVGLMDIELLKKERHHEELQVNIGNQVNQ